MATLESQSHVCGVIKLTGTAWCLLSDENVAHELGDVWSIYSAVFMACLTVYAAYSELICHLVMYDCVWFTCEWNLMRPFCGLPSVRACCIVQSSVLINSTLSFPINSNVSAPDNAAVHHLFQFHSHCWWVVTETWSVDWKWARLESVYTVLHDIPFHVNNTDVLLTLCWFVSFSRSVVAPLTCADQVN